MSNTRSVIALVGAGALVAGSVIIVAVWAADLAADRITVDHSPVGIVNETVPVVTELPTPIIVDSGVVTLPPCATEDSDDCYWNGATRGNGEGRSFVTIDGTTYPIGE